MAEGGGLLNRYRVVKPYRGFESLRLRQKHLNVAVNPVSYVFLAMERLCLEQAWLCALPESRAAVEEPARNHREAVEVR